jgi:hypothetical protein
MNSLGRLASDLFDGYARQHHAEDSGCLAAAAEVYPGAAGSRRNGCLPRGLVQALTP